METTTMTEIMQEILLNGELRKDELCSDNIIRYEVGTNGHMYGDSGIGTYLYAAVRDFANTRWNIVVERDQHDHFKGFKLIAEGDAELDLLAEAFSKIGEGLKEMGERLYEERKSGRRTIRKPEENDWIETLTNIKRR